MKITYSKEELNNLINNLNTPYVEIGRSIGVSGNYIRTYAKRIGIILPIRANYSEETSSLGKKRAKVIDKACMNCKNLINSWSSKFCSSKCSNDYRVNQRYLKYLDAVKNCTNISTYGNISKAKKYILTEQNGLCAICNIPDFWNDRKLVFVLDHIDGKADNNTRKNLRCVCPNCDSQLDTYKSKNKNSARKQRYLLNYKKQ